MKGGVYSQIGGLRPYKTSFPLRHSVTIDTDFGELCPVDIYECLPGDIFDMRRVNVVGRLTSSLDAPILAEFDVILEAFFCPTRLLMGSDANFDVPAGEPNYEDVLKGGKDGKSDLSVPYIKPKTGSLQFQYDGIADCLGIQPMATFGSELDYPNAFAWRAIRWIWNEFYRFEQLQDPIQVCQWLGDGSSSDSTFIDLSNYDAILYRGWRKDRFTSALPYQQFGDTPAFQLSGVLPVDLTGSYSASGSGVSPSSGSFSGLSVDYSYIGAGAKSVPSVSLDLSLNPAVNVASGSNTSREASITGSPSLSVNLNDAITFDIKDIRTNFQIQKWAERTARGGLRYTELLRSHFGISPDDSRLQRPDFIASFRLPWIINEVLQTSASQDGSTAQGNQAGQAISIGSGSLGRYRCYEYGYIIVFASVLPKPQYQQGIPPLFSRRGQFDFYSPEFAHLSEQAIKNKELFISGDTEVDNDVFGFTGIWNEYRSLPSRVARHMRSGAPTYSFDYWHLARYFQETPVLNAEFLQVGSTPESIQELHRIFAVQNEHPFVLDIGFDIVAPRPMPYLAEPGLVDHF